MTKLTRAGEGFYFVHRDALVALTCFLESANAAERAGPAVTGRVPNAYGVVGVALAAAGLRQAGHGYLDRGLRARLIAGVEQVATFLRPRDILRQDEGTSQRHHPRHRLR